MNEAEEYDSENTPSICSDCVGDPILKVIGGQIWRCVCCKEKVRKSISAESIARKLRDKILDRFEIHVDIHRGYDGLSLSQVVGVMIQVENSEFCDIVAGHLIVKNEGENEEGGFFYEGQEYAEYSYFFENEKEEREYLTSRWDDISRRLNGHQRFFNEGALGFFDTLFNEAGTAFDESDVEKSSIVIQNLESGTSIYRARIVSGSAELEEFRNSPNVSMNAPPSNLSQPNRMSPKGISFFYGSLEIATCISEIRPSIGHSVAVAKFNTKKTMKMFDFTKLGPGRKHVKLSHFIDNYTERKYQREFLDYFHEMIARPVVPGHDDEYIITQVMAEYLRHRHIEKFDGIIFKSVQCDGGINCVFFGERNYEESIFHVECFEMPDVYDVKKVSYSAKISEKYYA
ncbi:RES family NAD+ phosphorylase [Janthinobacterium lividum]